MEAMEERLKADVLSEASQCDGRVLVTDESPDASTYHLLLEVSPETVQTPREVFQELRDDGYNIVYNRIPVTDEKVRVTRALRAPRACAQLCRCLASWPGAGVRALLHGALSLAQIGPARRGLQTPVPSSQCRRCVCTRQRLTAHARAEAARRRCRHPSCRTSTR